MFSLTMVLKDCVLSAHVAFKKPQIDQKCSFSVSACTSSVELTSDIRALTLMQLESL